VDGGNSDGDAGRACTGIQPTFCGGSSSSSNSGSSGGFGSDDPRGGGWRWVTKAPEESRQVWAESTSLVIPLEGHVRVVLASPRLHRHS
jgi:hypothetical protein